MNSDFKGVRRSRRMNQFVSQLINQIDSIRRDAKALHEAGLMASSEGDAQRAIIHYENAFRLLSIVDRLMDAIDFYGI